MHRVALRALRSPAAGSANFLAINRLAEPLLLAHGVQFPDCLRIRGMRSECTLTTPFSNTDFATVAPFDARPPRKKLGWLPLLIALFCVSYSLMTMLIVEQGSTIESQRVLIRELFRDSSELSATKMKALRDKNVAARHAQAPTAQAPSSQNPSTQYPSTQYPSTQAQNQAPSSQAAPQHRTRNHGKATSQMPARPAADLADERRVLLSI